MASGTAITTIAQPLSAVLLDRPAPRSVRGSSGSATSRASAAQVRNGTRSVDADAPAARSGPSARPMRHDRRIERRSTRPRCRSSTTTFIQISLTTHGTPLTMPDGKLEHEPQREALGEGEGHIQGRAAQKRDERRTAPGPARAATAGMRCAVAIMPTPHTASIRPMVMVSTPRCSSANGIRAASQSLPGRHTPGR